MTTPSSYVFIEEDTTELESVEGKVLSLHRWHLAATQHVDGDRAAAEVRAEELASSHIPQYIAKRLKAGSRPYRSVFRMPDGTWLVKMKSGYQETHFRVSTGELVLMEEEIKGQDPPAPPRKGLNRLLGR
ncbi:hypothetical protein ACIRJR_03335 [Streptomyces sp. NPDC102402]|uniref:hypothetical protein n=1 Tax=Streptomyces sp. NPDC102402 TaxID=3366169 RepID=UPI003825533A